MDSEIKVPVQKALQMSLDEYIAENKIKDPTLLLSNGGRKQYRSSQAALSSSSDEEEPDCGGDVNMDSDYFENKFKDGMPAPRSQQWRLLPPNIQANRPPGMPPLVPTCAEKLHASLQSRSAMSSRQRDQSAAAVGSTPAQAADSKVRDLTISVDNEEFRKPKAKRTRWGNANKNRNNNKQPQQEQLHTQNGVSNGNANGVLRLGNNFKPGRLNVHQRIDYSYLSRQHHPGAQPPPRPLAIMSSNSQQPNASLAAGVAATMANANEAMIKQCFNMVPSVVEKILDQIQAAQRAKMDKKYDIKVQKEICELQGKPLMYTCPGAAVISCDGPGMEVEAPKLHTTEMSMNQRFA